MVRITYLRRTTAALPSQWEGRDDANRPVYIRYRWGSLGYILGQPGENTDAIATREYDVEVKVGGKYDGRLQTDEMLRHLAQTFELAPDAEVEEFT